MIRVAGLTSLAELTLFIFLGSFIIEFFFQFHPPTTQSTFIFLVSFFFNFIF